MKVLRSNCRTRIIFQQSPDDVISYKITEIRDIRLVKGEILFIGQGIDPVLGDEIIFRSNVEALTVPYTFTALEKVTRLLEWIACDTDSCCDDKGYFYDTYVNPSAISFGQIVAGDYSSYSLIPLNYEFPDDLTCNSAYEVHFHIGFSAVTGGGFNGVIDFFLDGVKIPEATTYSFVTTARDYDGKSSHFVVEGDKSGKVLTMGIANIQNATRGIENINATLTIRKIQ